MRKLLLLQILIWTFGICWSQTAEERANTAFRQLDAQRYTESISSYESLLAEGYASADLHFNLGLAYYRTAALGPAILHLEKAYKIAPYDGKVRKNLELIRNEQLDGLLPIPTFFLYDWWHRLASRLHPDTWSILAIIFAFAGAFGLFQWARYRHSNSKPAWYAKRRRQLIIGAIVFLFLAVLFVLFASSRSNALQKVDKAIVIPAEVDLYIAPGDDAEVDFMIHEGLKVRLLDDFEGWRKIELVDGRTGWVKAEEVEVI